LTVLGGYQREKEKKMGEVIRCIRPRKGIERMQKEQKWVKKNV
jgi:hypothetical protein